MNIDLRSPRPHRRAPALLGLLLAIGSGCTAPPTDAEIEQAVLWFPENPKYVDEARFSFEPAERRKALRALDDLPADTLFELVVDAKGKVRKARLLKTWVDRIYRDDLVDHARRMQFSADPDDDRYRAFYFPTTYGFESTVDFH